MPREIKLRVWDKIDKKMRKVLAIDFNKKFVTATFGLESSCLLTFDSISLIEYTGLKDINGKKIYEGDILEYQSSTGNTCTGIVRLGEYEQDGSGGEYEATKCLGFFIERLKVEPTECEIELCEDPYEPDYEKAISIVTPYELEVIGNIYDNPEVVKEGENARKTV